MWRLQTSCEEALLHASFSASQLHFKESSLNDVSVSLFLTLNSAAWSDHTHRCSHSVFPFTVLWVYAWLGSHVEHSSAWPGTKVTEELWPCSGSLQSALFFPLSLPSIPPQSHNKSSVLGRGAGEHAGKLSTCDIITSTWSSWFLMARICFLITFILMYIYTVILYLQVSPPLWATPQSRRPSTTASCSRRSAIPPSTRPCACPTTPPGGGPLPSAPSPCLLAPSSAGVWPNSCLRPCLPPCPPSHRYTHLTPEPEGIVSLVMQRINNKLLEQTNIYLLY